MSFTARGASGSLRCGGRPAALLRNWTFTPSGESWRVTASAVERDDYWLNAGTPKDLRLDLAATRWQFKDVAVDAGGAEMVITGTGTPEEL